MIIIGNPDREPIGRLHDQWGNTIFVRSDSPIDLLDAAMLAIGAPPQPEHFGLGGSLVPSGQVPSSSVDTIPTFTYVPAGDVVNHEIASEYASKISAYNAHVGLVKDIIVAIVSGKKPK